MCYRNRSSSHTNSHKCASLPFPTPVPFNSSIGYSRYPIIHSSPVLQCAGYDLVHTSTIFRIFADLRTHTNLVHNDYQLASLKLVSIQYFLTYAYDGVPLVLNNCTLLLFKMMFINDFAFTYFFIRIRRRHQFERTLVYTFHQQILTSTLIT